MHFYQPETSVNIKLAGGRRAIFRLEDVTHFLEDQELKRKPRTWASFRRELEIFPLVHLHSKFLGQLSFAFFHPVMAFREIRGWLAYKLGRN